MTQGLQTWTVVPEQAGATLAGFLRTHLPTLTWSQVRRLVETRRVRVGGDLCLDPARRLREGNVVELTSRPAPKPRPQETIQLRYLDPHLVVAEKPAGMCTVRHPLERPWPERRKELSPTLEDIVPKLIARQESRPFSAAQPRLRIVQRLDKETSGLVVFARTVPAERGLGRQFHAHTVIRRYLAIVPGFVQPQRMATRLVRDRGDGRRGSTLLPGAGKEAITHIDVVERLPGYTLLSCRLETGRTHQIRIHLAELGHPICGEKVYNHHPDGSVQPDPSEAPRLALHAAELGFVHPINGETLHWTMPLPNDLETFLLRHRVAERVTKQPQRAAQAGRNQVMKKPSKRRKTDGDQVDRH
ncbi:MAG TPA: RluA family pseudouridine synthase [Gemmataceae bacterium]|nr:RluA family pseudouridine synthase [Gemmataceae bacterium]